MRPPSADPRCEEIPSCKLLHTMTDGARWYRANSVARKFNKLSFEALARHQTEDPRVGGSTPPLATILPGAHFSQSEGPAIPFGWLSIRFASSIVSSS